MARPAPQRKPAPAARPAGSLGGFADVLSLLAVTVWAGALWAVGYIAAPVLFASLGDKVLAGAVAGRMFTIVGYIGMASGIYLLLHRLATYRMGALKQAFFWAAALMLLIAVGIKYGIQPVMESLKAQAFPAEVMHSAFRDRFATWHGVSSVVYLVQSLLAVVLVLKR